MWTMDNHIFIICIFLPVLLHALRDVSIIVPAAVKRGDIAELYCFFDTEADALYSVKWYKGRKEFYRYTPKENPAKKTFPNAGVTVLLSQSNETKVTIGNVQLAYSAKYTCEVSVEAPSFQTLLVSKELEVIVTPSNKPVITGIKQRYSIENSLRANCTTRDSKPPANLTWTINHKPVNIHNTKLIKIRDDRTHLETTICSIQIILTTQHFIKGKLRLRCKAQMYDIYDHETERIVEQIREKSTKNYSYNSINEYSPYDQTVFHDDEVYDRKDGYLTHVQAENAVKGKSASSLTLNNKLLQFLSIYNLIKFLKYLFSS